MLGLMPVDKIADRAAATVDAIPDAVQSGIERRRVADQHERIQRFEVREPRGQFGFTILTRSVERRRAGVAQTGDVIFANFERLPVEIPEAELRAKGRDLRLRFMIPRKDVDLAGALSQNLSAGLEAAAPVHQVAGRDVVVSIHGHEPFQCLMVAVDVGEDEELHDKKVPGVRCQVSARVLKNRESVRWHIEPKT